MPAHKSSAEQPNHSPLSLSRLREAFTAMLGGQAGASAEQSAGSTEYVPLGAEQVGQVPSAGSHTSTCEVNPRSVVEAILFVGRPDNRPMSARELAAAMRGVSPSEVETVVRELNRLYDADEAPYRIEESHAGYRLALRKEFERMRDKFYGRAREAKLSPAALELLSIIAYNQPITAEEISQLRGSPNGAALSTLVRRRLVQIDRPTDKRGKPTYSTTDRFLRLFGLESLAALPQSEELEKV
jgi:segregation and condensation protein B